MMFSTVSLRHGALLLFVYRLTCRIIAMICMLNGAQELHTVSPQSSWRKLENCSGILFVVMVSIIHVYCCCIEVCAHKKWQKLKIIEIREIRLIYLHTWCTCNYYNIVCECCYYFIFHSKHPYEEFCNHFVLPDDITAALLVRKSTLPYADNPKVHTYYKS